MPMTSALNTQQLTGRSDKLMLITPDRICYAGALGRPHTRQFGAITVYVSLGSPLHILFQDGKRYSTDICVVQPDTPHEIATVDRRIGVYMIEPESIDMDRLPEWFTADQAALPAALHQRLRDAFLSLADGSVHVNAIRPRLDEFFLGHALPSRKLEWRMAAVVNRIKRNPSDSVGAEEYADQVDLSFSRFLHLFKEEVGTTFRRFRAWKRARNFMSYVNTERNLTDIALETGFPDSSHFSHTVRHYWGLTPRDIIAGSRRLAVINDASFVSTAH
ncbi:helix-turn-helix domain-containing protein [Noviherbaspirillum galbum]|uniref:Helix-turn-helix transcriptional regulator n=1 Tax=Noviherbaspirillum galbum TaxID=2709383 RepID=A0A6B3SWD5_9BURK|nr:AraC family transcriptional regulator [Noviherbaspirillum galbum]NEX63735.1 helix-turn-helix transcriptional regulator [Noviherbaspirillum galbum]